MRVLATAYSDTGSRKVINQDGYFVKSGHFGEQLVCLAVICDGMGGFDAGEKASNTVITGLEQWFDSHLKKLILNHLSEQELDNAVNEFLREMNNNLISYGIKDGIKLGTTCSILLIIGTKAFIYHVGDSRIYHQSQGEFNLLTEDQTVAARWVKSGKMTPEEAHTSRERSILLQCIGVKNDIIPYKRVEEVNEGDSFLLCSDGFYYALNDNEIKELLIQSNLQKININLEQLIDKVRIRGEVDDATAVVMRLTHY